MKLRYVYKDVTYEMLKNNEFKNVIEKHKKLGFYFKSHKIVSETDAIKAKNIDVQASLFD